MNISGWHLAALVALWMIDKFVGFRVVFHPTTRRPKGVRRRDPRADPYSCSDDE